MHTPDAARQHKKQSLKGMLMMLLCCAAPLLILGAVAVLGISLGALANGLVSIAALFACPVSMYLMMRMMHTKEQANPEKPASCHHPRMDGTGGLMNGGPK